MITIVYTVYMAGGDPRGVFGVSRPPLQKYIKEAKRMMYWYKNTKMHFLKQVSFQHCNKTTYVFKGVAPTTPPTPYLAKYFLVFT